MTLKIGILGLGTVGGGVVKILQRRGEELSRLLGKTIEITAVMSRRDNRLEELGLSRDIYTNSFDEFLTKEVDVVVEAIGGDAPAPVIVESLKKGVAVVSANKALLAKEGKNLLGIDGGRNLYYEASCCGGIPIVSSFEEGLLANRITSLMGIFNGTCNYILTEMKDKGVAFSEVLADAQKLGYAEADPTFDVEGIDASHKLCLLGSLAFQQRIPFEKITSEGITQLTPEDFSWAADHGYTIKLISMAEEGDEGLHVGTSPMLIPSSHPLANVNGANNAVFVHGDAVGELMFYGAGAGEMPTASAMVSDIIAAGQKRDRQWSHRVFSEGPSLESASSNRNFSFYIRLKTRDEIGMLAKLCAAFSEKDISLKFVHQNDSHDGEAEIVFTTHPQSAEAVQGALASMEKNDLTIGSPLILRILD